MQAPADQAHPLRERVANLSDEQVARALRLDHDLWDDAAFAASGVLTTPEANRRLLINRFEQAIAVGDPHEELARIETIFTDVTADEPDPGADDACWMIAWRVDGSEYRIMRSDSDAWEQFPIHDDAWAHYGCEAFESPATAGLGLAHIAAGRVNDRWGGNIDWAISRDALSGPPRPAAPGRARIRRQSQPASPEAVAGFVRDPRVVAIVDGLTTDQVADVLRQMNAAWTPDEDPEKLLSTPEGNRGLLIEVASMNLGMGGEDEIASLIEMADFARRAHPAE